MSEHDFEPVRGLPADLPKGERMLWQGAPDWWSLGQRAFHMRTVAGYFVLLMVWRGIAAAMSGIAPLEAIQAGLQLAPLAMAALGLLAGLAVLTARTTVYTITTKRLVMRFGLALPKAINIPFTIIESAALKAHADKTGDLAITLTAPNTINYFLLWPHARPWKLSRPEPALRAVADAQGVAATFAEALRHAHGAVNASPVSVPQPQTASATPDAALSPA